MKRLISTYISSLSLLYVSIFSCFPKPAFASDSCPPEIEERIRASCKPYQTFDSSNCRCESNDDYTYEERQALQADFDACVEDEESQECFEQIVADSAGLTDDCKQSYGETGCEGDECDVTDYTKRSSSGSIVTTADQDSGLLVPPSNFLCAKESGKQNHHQKFTGVLRGMYIGISLFMYLGFKKAEGIKLPQCYGNIAFIAANAISLIWEIGSWLFSQDKLTTLVDEYEQKTKCTVGGEEVADCESINAYDAQVEAFNFMLEERKILSELAGSKSVSYWVSGGAMAVAGILLIIQTFTTGSWGGCGFQTENSPQRKNKTYAEKIFDRFNNKVNSIIEGFKNKITNSTQKGFKKSERFNTALRLKKEKHFNISPLPKKAEAFSCWLDSIPGFGEQIKQEESAVRTMPLIGQMICYGTISGIAIGVLSLIEGVNLNTLLGNSLTSAILGLFTIIIAWFYISLAIHYGNFKKAAMDQHDRIEAVKDAILAQIELKCPGGRDDPGDVRCFCYNEDGSRRSDREKSDTCQNLWESLDFKIELEAGNLTPSKVVQKKCCVSIDGGIDCACNCQNFKNKKTGKNACLKVAPPTNVSRGIGSLDAVNQALNNINNQTGASGESGSVNTSNLKRNAKTLLNVGKQMLQKYDDKNKKKNKKAMKVPSMAGAFDMAKNLSQQVKSSDGIPFSGGSTGKKVKENKALASVKKSLKKKGYSFVGGGSLKRKKKAKEKKQDFGFAFDGPDDLGGGEKTERFMDKNYKYKKEDIYKNNAVSLWKIITNRYNASGYLRLFDDEKEQANEQNK
ncbi:MAG: hypothetical protein CME61_04445 [Halobacteriovoraceae bacterium]|nr:hypothetical protein [Halobacteriovoraceae bacterium]